ncbi:hypothetical protein OIU77_007777 [Salix suchowensis]|uniref:Uncharacterized protein n=1 Tax=Salix suchowensis TaxID=1278906 RepID=A0ABQ9AHH1_9ROSI|nr:hypothetical protein OIU77_007777 [Salix suchowensis]
MSLLLELPHEPQLLQTVEMVNPLFPSYRFTWFDILTSSALASTSKLSLDVKSEVTNHKVLLSGMDKSEDSAAAAAVAFRHICDGTVLFR